MLMATNENLREKIIQSIKINPIKSKTENNTRIHDD